MSSVITSARARADKLSGMARYHYLDAVDTVASAWFFGNTFAKRAAISAVRSYSFLHREEEYVLACSDLVAELRKAWNNIL